MVPNFSNLMLNNGYGNKEKLHYFSSNIYLCACLTKDMEMSNLSYQYHIPVRCSVYKRMQATKCRPTIYLKDFTITSKLLRLSLLLIHNLDYTFFLQMKDRHAFMFFNVVACVCSLLNTGSQQHMANCKECCHHVYKQNKTRSFEVNI